MLVLLSPFTVEETDTLRGRQLAKCHPTSPWEIWNTNIGLCSFSDNTYSHKINHCAKPYHAALLMSQLSFLDREYAEIPKLNTITSTKTVSLTTQSQMSFEIFFKKKRRVNYKALGSKSYIFPNKLVSSVPKGQKLIMKNITKATI